jgi:hypothetical protein
METRLPDRRIILKLKQLQGKVVMVWSTSITPWKNIGETEAQLHALFNISTAYPYSVTVKVKVKLSPCLTN